MGYMLEIQNIHKTFNPGTINEKVALNGVNLNLNPGDFVTIIGGNGAGKSTTLNAIAGVWSVDEGKIIIDGVDITKLSEHKRALYLGRVFQDPMTGTAATMSIEENMAIAARRGERRGLGWGITKKERARYKEALTELGVTGMTITQVMGCGTQKGHTNYYRGIKVEEAALLPKIKLEVVVSKVPVADVIALAKKVLYTGHIGDGKIFVYDVENVVKVRTGEEGYDALQGD